MSFKRVLAGVGALGLMGAVSMALAAPSSAGAPPAEDPDEVQLDATVSPTVVAPGETVTVTSVEPCPAETDIHFYYYLKVGDPQVGGDGPHIPLDDEGHWSTEFKALTASEISGGDPHGDYIFEATCWPRAEECYDTPEVATSATEEPDCTLYFYEETFTVEEASTTPTTAPPGTPPPAQPIVDDPPFTG